MPQDVKICFLASERKLLFNSHIWKRRICCVGRQAPVVVKVKVVDFPVLIVAISIVRNILEVGIKVGICGPVITPHHSDQKSQR